MLVPQEKTEIHTWFERDRAHVELREKESQETLVEWWDEEVASATEDGFLDPNDYHGSAYAGYVRSLPTERQGSPGYDHACGYHD